MLNHSYSYDSLDNLTARTDANLGTQESFSYDSLNRLSLSTNLGGAVSPPSTMEVMYDARGNITYKSDVGRYWYDAQRPNRMTNVTLETAPGAQNVPNQHYSTQLKDYVAFAQQEGLTFQLFVRWNTILSNELKIAIEDGLIQLERIPVVPLAPRPPKIPNPKLLPPGER